MVFQPIDLDTYARREHYEHYLRLQLTYSATVPIDITTLRNAVKAHGYRIYPVQIWMLTTAANRIPEFRMSRNDHGALGIWDRVDALYTVLPAPDRPFSTLWTPYSPDFATFYQRCIADMETWPDGRFEPQGDIPSNVLNISSIPWVAFTGFNLNLVTDYLLPILTIGQHTQQNGKTLMPLSIQVHHAVCDGYHLGQFIEQVKTIAESAPEWLNPQTLQRP